LLRVSLPNRAMRSGYTNAVADARMEAEYSAFLARGLRAAAPAFAIRHRPR